MFRATMRPSSGETTVFMRHLVLVDDCLVCRVDDDGAHRCPNHVEIDKYTKK